MATEPLRVGLLGSFWNMGNTGSGQYTRRLYEQLAQRNEISVTPFIGSEIEPDERPDEATLLKAPLRFGENVAKLWQEQVSFARSGRRMGMDLLHVPYWAPPYHHHLPVVVTVHDIIPLLLPEYRGSRRVQAYMRLASAACRRAEVVLTDSKASARDIVTHLRVPEERVCRVYLAADEMYQPADEGNLAELRERLGLPDRYLLYLGGFDCRKNVLLLLQAFEELSRGDPDIVLVVAGKLPDEDTAFHPDPRRYVMDRCMERIQFLGWVDEQDKPALYSGALGFCFPSSYEGFGLPVLEALSCGTPVIVGDNSSLPEVAGPGGLVVPLEALALAEAMQQLVENDSLRQQLASAGMAHAAGFSWKTTADETIQAYRTALEDGRN